MQYVHYKCRIEKRKNTWPARERTSELTKHLKRLQHFRSIDLFYFFGQIVLCGDVPSTFPTNTNNTVVAIAAANETNETVTKQKVVAIFLDSLLPRTRDQECVGDDMHMHMHSMTNLNRHRSV